MLGLGLRPQWDRDSPERPEEAEKGQPYPRFGALLPREQCPKGRMRTVLQPAVSRQAVHYNSFKTHLPPELLVPGHTQDRQLATGGCFGLSVLCEMGPGDKAQPLPSLGGVGFRDCEATPDPEPLTHCGLSGHWCVFPTPSQLPSSRFYTEKVWPPRGIRQGSHVMTLPAFYFGFLVP